MSSTVAQSVSPSDPSVPDCQSLASDMGKRKADTEQAQEEGAGLSAYESERQLLCVATTAVVQ